MKEKLLQFFTGKMGKAVYISIASAVVCGVVVITSTVIVHNNNQKIDSVLESLTATESVAELSSESVTESVSNIGNTDSDAQAKAPNGEPAGDKALQYLAEYNALTEEYERKRAELEKQANIAISGRNYALSIEPKPLSQMNFDTEEEYQQHLKKIEEEHKLWEIESQKVESQKAEDQRKAAEANAKINEARKKISDLDEQYNKDVTKLKQKYGIS